MEKTTQQAQTIKQRISKILQEATENNASSNAIKSVSEEAENNNTAAANDTQNNESQNNAVAETIAQETIENQAAEEIHKEETAEGKDKTDTEVKAAARAYAKNTIGDKNFYDPLVKNISNSISSWLDSTTKIDLSTPKSQIDSAAGQVTMILNNKKAQDIMSTSVDVGKKLTAFEKSNFYKEILDGTAAEKTSKNLHDLFSKVGFKGGDKIIDYVSNKIIGTMSGEKFKKIVFTDKNSVLKNLQNFTKFMDNMQKTITEINKIVQEIKNQIYVIAENAIKTVVNTVKKAISDIVGGVVKSAVGTLKDSLSDAWKAGNGEEVTIGGAPAKT